VTFTPAIHDDLVLDVPLSTEIKLIFFVFDNITWECKISLAYFAVNSFKFKLLTDI